MGSAGTNVEFKKDTKILLISNDDELSFVTGSLLKMAGLTQHTVCQDALKAIPLCSDDFDLVIIDSNVRNLPGWDLIKVIKNAEDIPNRPIIFIGKEDVEVSADQMNEYGVIDFLKHPFDLKKLMKVLAKTYSNVNEEGNIEHDYTKAKEELRNNNAEGAVQQFEKIREQTKNSTRSSLGLAKSLEQNHKEEEAEKVVEQIDDDQDISVLMQKVKLHLKRRDTAKAKEDIDKLMKIADTNAFTFISPLKACIEGGHDDLAKIIINKAESLGVKHQDIEIAIAELELKENQVKDAIKRLVRAQKEYGQSFEIMELKGRCLMKSKRHQEAIDCYISLLGKGKDDAKVCFNIALAYHETKQVDKAKEYLEKCLEISPTFIMAKRMLRNMSAA